MYRRINNQMPEATVARLPIYRRVLAELTAEDESDDTVSSEELAIRSGVNAAQVRKDLSYLGSHGTPGVGYEIRELSAVVSRELGLSRDWPVVIAGLGNLGTALANYLGFAERGFPVTALVDSDPAKVGKAVGNTPIHPMSELKTIVAKYNISVGIIATPASAAQEVATYFTECQIRSILNFAPTVVNVPEGINLRQVDLSVELQVLSFYQDRQDVSSSN